MPMSSVIDGHKHESPPFLDRWRSDPSPYPSDLVINAFIHTSRGDRPSDGNLLLPAKGPESLPYVPEARSCDGDSGQVIDNALCGWPMIRVVLTEITVEVFCPPNGAGRTGL